MAVRNFDGTDDVITCSIGTMSTQDSGPITIVVLARRKATTEMVPVALHASSGPAADRGRSALDMDAGDSYMLNDAGFASAGLAFDNDTWLIGAVSKAAGTVAPRFHRYIYSTTTWTHATSGNTLADGGTPGASGTLRFGQWGTGLFFNGRIAAAAIYNQVLSDATLEGFTADAQSWLDAGPVGMWLLNQAAITTAVDDVTGNGANQTAIVGTNVVTGDDPPGFDFSLGGGQSATVGQVTETDTAQGLTRAKTLGQPTQTDTAQAFTATKTASIGLTAETDLAQAITAVQGGGGQTVAVGQATETDTAQAFTRAKTLGLVTQTDQALAITATKTVTIGQAVETDTAQTIILPGVVGQAVEADTALSITATKTAALGLVIETDTAQGFARVLELALVVETELALAVVAQQQGFADTNPLHSVYRESSGHTVYRETAYRAYRESVPSTIYQEGT